MLVIEAGDKRILHTRDFRGHGYLSKSLYKELPRLAKKDFDAVITEGTMLSRMNEIPLRV